MSDETVAIIVSVLVVSGIAGVRWSPPEQCGRGEIAALTAASPRSLSIPCIARAVTRPPPRPAYTTVGAGIAAQPQQ